MTMHRNIPAGGRTPPNGSRPSRIKEILDRAAAGDTHVIQALKNAILDTQRALGQEITAERLDQITQDLGDQKAGRVIALSEGDEPTDATAIGVFVSSNGEDFPEGTFHIGGVNNGDLQFGLSAENGKAIFGAGNVTNDAMGSTYYGTTDGQVYLSFRQMVALVDEFLGSLTAYYDGVDDIWSFIVMHAGGDSPALRSNIVLYASDQDNTDFRYSELQLSSTDDLIAYVSRMLWDLRHPTDATAPTAAVAAGGSVDVGVHRYAVTFVTAYGETTISNTTGDVTTTGGNQTVNLSAVPVGKDNCTARKIYRTTAGNKSDWKLLTTIADNTTATYSDTTADASLGAAPPVWNDSGVMDFIEPTTVSMEGVQILPTLRSWKPKAPVAALVATAVGNIANGAYSYKMSFVDSGGNETLSDASNSVTVDASHKQVTLTLDMGPAAYGRYIYRNASGSKEWVKLVWIGDNTTLSYTDNIADGSMVGGTYSPVGDFNRPVFPRHAFWLFNQMNPSTAMQDVIDTGQQLNFVTLQVTAANGDWWTMGLWLDAGSYTLTLMGETNTGHGKLDGFFDGTQIITTNDWYAAASNKNVTRAFSVTVNDAGYHLLRLTINGKNASASDYKMRLTYLKLDMDED